MSDDVPVTVDAQAMSAAAAAQQAWGTYPRIRWMGSKYKLLPHLAQTFEDVGGSTALDAFSGSGVVSYLLKCQGFSVTANDLLQVCTTIADATVVNQGETLDAYDLGRILGENRDGRSFIQDTFTDVFYTPDDLAFLDSAWSHIARMQGPKRSLALSALVLSAARKQPRGVFTISGDLSRYDDGRRDLRMSMREQFIARVADYNAAVFEGAPARTTRQEATQMEPGEYDVVYMDPPYAPPSDDNDYTKRFHFLEGLSRYWEGDEVMRWTKTKKLPKVKTGYSSKRTIVEAFRTTFRHYAESGAIVLSYGSNALPDMDTIVSLLRETRSEVEVREIPHRYHYGNHGSVLRAAAKEYIFIAR